MRAWLLASWVALVGCADVKPLVDGQSFGPVTALVDLFTSCHLMETRDGPVLFDACWRKEELTSRLDARGLAPGQVATVVLTHGLSLIHI